MPSLTAALLLGAGLVSGAAAEELKLLNIGDPAPEFKVAKWIKGEPLDGFAKGKVYVLDFWATWCGPCRQLMPHITELAGKYQGKATFVGVSILEKKETEEENLSGVAQFVEGMGDRIGFRVAADGKANFMAKHWFDAAAEEGIPTTFVVDGEGKIAWIGHPTDLEKVLDSLFKGTFDNRALAASRRQEKETIRLDRKIMGAIAPLVKQGKFKEAIDQLDRSAAEYPDYKKKLAFLRFNLLLKLDEAKGYAFARELAEGAGRNDPMLLYQLARTIVEGDLKTPDFGLAVACAKRANELTDSRSPIVGAALAAAQFKNGEHAKAVETMEKAVDQADDVPDLPTKTKKQFHEKLEEYKRAVKKSANP